ncbi:MAG TPA: nitroreductase [Gammaproteobacteria bacterium]
MPDSVPRLRPAQLDDFADAIRSRRSIDLFEPGAPGTEVLLQAIELARWAPNHRLTEPWRFYLIGERTADDIVRFAAEFETAVKGEQAGAARFARLKAIPAFFVLTCRKSDDALLQQEDYAACCCAAQNLMLYLWQCGIGVKWTTGAMTRERRFYEIVGIDPAAEMLVGFFWYGRPKVVPSKKRREVAAIVVQRP